MIKEIKKSIVIIKVNANIVMMKMMSNYMRIKLHNKLLIKLNLIHLKNNITLIY